MRESTGIDHDPTWTVVRSSADADSVASMPVEIDGRPACGVAPDPAVERRMARRSARLLARDPAIASQRASHPGVRVPGKSGAGNARANHAGMLQARSGHGTDHVPGDINIETIQPRV